MSAVGIVSVVALTAGCSSSSAGHPVAAKSASPLSVSASTPANGGASTPADGGVSGTVTVPTGLPSVSVPALGGSKFCTDFTGQGGIANILSGSGDGLDKYLKAWDTMVDEAPAQIKSDVQAVSDYLHAAVKGNVDPNAASKLTTAYTNIGEYIATNCH